MGVNNKEDSISKICEAIQAKNDRARQELKQSLTEEDKRDLLAQKRIKYLECSYILGIVSIIISVLFIFLRNDISLGIYGGILFASPIVLFVLVGKAEYLKGYSKGHLDGSDSNGYNNGMDFRTISKTKQEAVIDTFVASKIPPWNTDEVMRKRWKHDRSKIISKDEHTGNPPLPMPPGGE